MTDRNIEYAKKLSQMIQCQTTSFEGQTDYTCFYNFQNLLRALFPNIFREAEFRDEDGSFVLIWKGKTSEKPVMFMNHQDTVPALGDWTHDPFKGEIADGKLWGRGTLDTKGGLFGMLQAADELAQKGFVPSRDIWFESSRCEEVGLDGIGCDKIAQKLEQQGIRFDFILDEGGMIVYDPIGGAKGNFAMVGVAEKGYADLKFVARSTGGHASTPGKNTPLVKLGRFMAAYDKANIFEASLPDVSCEMFCRLSKKMKGFMKLLLGHPRFFKKLLVAVMPKVSATANAILRTTVAFTIASGSEASNVLPQQAYVIGNMRYSHHQGQQGSIKAIKDFASKFGIETEVLDPGFPSGVSSYKTDSFNLIEKAVASSFEDVITSPYIQTGASDSRYMSRVCDNIYRFVPFKISDEQLKTVHGLNENVDVSTLGPAVEFYKYIMENL